MRERQIMAVLHRRAPATVADVVEGLRDAVSYNSVRVTLGVLERKGHVAHRRDGKRYVYAPRVRRDRAQRSALRHVMETFFDGSAPGVVSTLLDLQSQDLSDADLDQLQRLISQARRARRS